MSGTSLDGVDTVAVRFSDRAEVVASRSSTFHDGLRNILYELAKAETVRMDTLVRANFLLAEIYARDVNELLNQAQLTSDQITAIGLHGQTVRHLTSPESIDDLPAVRATLQLGSGAALAALTGIDVVSDFRAADIAVGGQGAPFVPMFDAAFFSSSMNDRITLNIGGISNLTWLSKSQISNDIVAFDTGPGNMIIDALMRKYFDRPYDENGRVATSGRVQEDFLEELLADPYFSAPPPKSTGRELFGDLFRQRFEKEIESRRVSTIDAVTTASALTVQSIARATQWLPRSESCELIVSGGGAKNIYLMESLRRARNCVVTTSESLGIPVHEKEAIAFAYFAKAFIDDELIHLPRTTGATKQVMLGCMSKGKIRMKT